MKPDFVDGVSESVVDAWREDVASSAELRRAYTKFVWRRREQPRPRRLGRWALAALVFSSGLAFAAVGVRVVRSALEAPKPPAAAAVPGAIPAAERASQQRLNQPIPVPAASLEVVEASPPPAPPLRAPAKASPSAKPAKAAAPAEAGSSAWQRAAKGLRERDVVATEAALRELELSGSAADGEAARLVRGQLLLAVGRVTEAEWQLEKLAAEARSPAIKRKTALLLNEIRERGLAQRARAGRAGAPAARSGREVIVVPAGEDESERDRRTTDPP